MPPPVSIVIPTENLERSLLLSSSLLSVLKKERVESIFICLHHTSPDAGASVSKSGLLDGKIQRVVYSGKSGYGAGCNAGVRACCSPYILFINDDVELTHPFLEPLFQALEAEDVFAATPGVLTYKNRHLTDEARTGFHFTKGFVWGVAEGDPSPLIPGKPYEVAWATGACFLTRRESFQRLGGFDLLYSPAYWEDVDLSFRAYQQGMRVLHCPTPPVYHRRGQTLSSLPRSTRLRLFYRNQLLFHWKNLTSPSLRRLHFTFAILKNFYAPARLDLAYPLAFQDAFRIWKESHPRPVSSPSTPALTDVEILQRFQVFH